MYGFEKLTVWKKAIDLCELIHKESKRFPKREFSHFLNIALWLNYLSKN
jgi:hypothetical protein